MFWATMLKSRLCDQIDAYIPLNEAITTELAGTNAAAQTPDERNKQLTFKYCGPFFDCIR